MVVDAAARIRSQVTPDRDQLVADHQQRVDQRRPHQDLADLVARERGNRNGCGWRGLYGHVSDTFGSGMMGAHESSSDQNPVKQLAGGSITLTATPSTMTATCVLAT